MNLLSNTLPSLKLPSQSSAGGAANDQKAQGQNASLIQQQQQQLQLQQLQQTAALTPAFLLQTAGGQQQYIQASRRRFEFASGRSLGVFFLTCFDFLWLKDVAVWWNYVD